jgi:sugar diacid utilization regulator
VDIDTTTVRSHLEDLLTIAEIARNLNDFRPLDETMELICERVAGMPACDWVTISLVSEEGDSTKSWGDRHIKPEFLSWARSQNRLEKSLKSPVFHAVASGRPVLISDVAERTDLPALRAGANVQGIRAMAYLPITTRGRVLGTMNCYTSTPHQHTDVEIDLLQTVARLAGVAAETALIAERQRLTSERLQRLTRELSDRNLELSHLSEAQVRLTEGMTETFGDAVQRVADGLAAETGGSVMVVTPDGRTRAFSGPPEGQKAITATLERRDFAKLPNSKPLWDLDDCTVIRVGTPRTLGLLIVHPGVPDAGRTSLVLLRHTAAILAFEFEVENSDRTLRDLARPSALLALVRGELSPAQAQAMATVLAAPGEPLRALVIDVADDQAAGRVADALNRAPRSWGNVAAVAEGPRAISLVLDRAATTIESRLAPLLEERQILEWRAGLSAVFREVGELSMAVGSAGSALRVAGPSSRLVTFDELGPTADLLEMVGRDRAARFVDDLLGAVVAYDAKRSTDLILSLGSYLEHRGSLRQAAGALRVHTNTLQLRLARITQLTGIDLHDPEQLGLVAMAIAWKRLL